MMHRFQLRRWVRYCIAICFFWWGAWISPAPAIPEAPSLAPELIALPQRPFHQFPAIPCTDRLQLQFNQQAKIPLTCNIGDLLPAEQVLTIGNFASLGLTQSSLWQIANVNQLDLNLISADQLQSFYRLVTPNKLLSNRFGDFYQNQVLDKLPLVKEALLQNIAAKIQLDSLSQLQPLNNLLQQAGGDIRGYRNWLNGDVLNDDLLRQKLSALKLGDLVTALPDFGDIAVGDLPLPTLQSFSVAQAIPDLANQSIGTISGVESLTLGDLGSVGLPNLSLSQMPNPIALATGVNFGRFDLPLSHDEKDLGRQLAGGIPNGDYQLRQEGCSNTCKFAEISAPNTNFHGAAWVDGNEHWVADGFGLVCWTWPGGCKGPAGNHPFGRNLRLLLTNIDAATGTAQVSFTFPICWDVWFVGTTCTPAIFPVSSGIPLYTIREGDWLPFIVPINYGERKSSWVRPSSPEQPIPRST